MDAELGAGRDLLVERRVRAVGFDLLVRGVMALLIATSLAIALLPLFRDPTSALAWVARDRIVALAIMVSYAMASFVTGVVLRRLHAGAAHWVTGYVAFNVVTSLYLLLSQGRPAAPAIAFQCADIAICFAMLHYVARGTGASVLTSGYRRRIEATPQAKPGTSVGLALLLLGCELAIVVGSMLNAAFKAR